MVFARKFVALCLSFSLSGVAVTANAAGPLLRVGVLVGAPPMSFQAADGTLSGFSPAIARALCAEMAVECEFHPARLDFLIDELVADRFDFVATGLLKTPERSQKVLFSKPVYRSITLWVARPGVNPGHKGVRISTFKGSAQEAYARAKHWDTIAAQDIGQMLEQLKAGVAQAAIVPLMTSIGLRENPEFAALPLQSTVLQIPGLDVYARFAVNPRRAGLQEELDRALDRIKRNGSYERINSEFLPFRVE
ncbi:MAG: transporter substrate-binding domain-containing protein [Azonexus sp.]